MAQILVVDDSGYARRTMRKTLEQASHTVSEANGGMAAIESYYLNRPDLVLLDLTMEDVGGFDVLQRMREIDPGARVIVVSADVQSSTAKLVEAAGGARFLGKPVQTQELLETIDAVLAEAKE
jgi:two-component system, chemotaxis family, chemotaxis protein CheY